MGQAKFLILKFIGNSHFKMISTCPFCQGAGQSIKTEDYCETCNGNGLIDKNSNMDISIPKNIPIGARLRFENMGKKTSKNSLRGNAYLDILPQKHDIFNVDEESNIVLEYPICFSQACLGCKINVPTLHGNREISIDPGMPNNEVFYLPNTGLPNGGSYTYTKVIVTYETPKVFDDDYKKILDQIKEYENKENFKKTFSMNKTIEKFLTKKEINNE